MNRRLSKEKNEQQIVFMLNSSLKIVRMLNDSLALRDMTNMTKLKTIFKFVRSRHSNKNINFIQSQDSKISHCNYVAKSFQIVIFHDNNKNKQLNNRNYFH